MLASQLEIENWKKILLIPSHQKKKKSWTIYKSTSSLEPSRELKPKRNQLTQNLRKLQAPPQRDKHEHSVIWTKCQ